jgi:hypothetical protein
MLCKLCAVVLWQQRWHHLCLELQHWSGMHHPVTAVRVAQHASLSAAHAREPWSHNTSTRTTVIYFVPALSDFMDLHLQGTPCMLASALVKH